MADRKQCVSLITGGPTNGVQDRVSANANKVIYDETINIGERLRTLDVSSSGRIFIGTDSGKILILENDNSQVNGQFPALPK